MLSDYQRVKTAIGIPASDNSQDAKIQQLLQAADQVVKSYCHRSFEQSPYIIEYPWFGNTPDLPLLQRPITPVLATATLTKDSTQLTNIAATAPYTNAQIQSGMPVAVTGATSTANLRTSIPPFTTISNLSPTTSPTSVTLSNAATVSGDNVPVIFGLDVYIDFGGNYGFGRNAFRNGPGNSSRLYAGLDYAPKVDSPDGSVKSGLLVMLYSAGYGGGLWALAPMGWGFGGMGGYGPYGGPRTQAMPPVWPTFPGAVCILYSAGVGGPGAAAPDGLLPEDTTTPADLTFAVTELAVWLWNNADTGTVLVTSESFQGYNRGLMDQAGQGLAKAESLGRIRDVLSRYAEVIV